MSYGLQIVIKGSDASASNLPKLVENPRGFSGSGLVGLYLFDDPDAIYRDSSSAGNTGTGFLGYAAPTLIEAGLSVTNSNGFVMDTGITQPNEFTVVACLRHTIDVSTAGARNYVWVSDTANGVPANAAGSFAHNVRAVAGMRLGVDSTYNAHCVWDGSATQLSSGNNQMSLSAGTASEFRTMAWGVSVAASQFYLRSPVSDFTRNDPEIAGAFAASPTKRIVLGLCALNTAKPVAGQIVGFAVYNKYLNGSELSAVYAAFDAIKAERGL